MEGRYVTLMHQEVDHIWSGEKQHFFYTITIFSEVINYGKLYNVIKRMNLDKAISCNIQNKTNIKPCNNNKKDSV